MIVVGILIVGGLVNMWLLIGCLLGKWLYWKDGR